MSPAEHSAVTMHAEQGALVDEVLATSRVKAELAAYRGLVARTIEVFGDELKAASWLSTPSADLGGKVPLQVAQEVRYSPAELERSFEPIFVRIEEGIYW